MKTLSEEEKKLFIEKHIGKEMLFLCYHKHKFNYKFEYEGVKYLLVCGNVNGDIYGDSWCNIEKIRNVMWGSRFVHNIYIC